MIDPNQDFESYFNSLPQVDAQLPAGDYRSTMQPATFPMMQGTLTDSGYTIPGIGTIGITDGATNGQWTPDPTAQHYNAVSASGAPTSGNTGINGTPTGTVQPAPTASGAVTMQAFNQAWLNSPYPGTVDGLKQFMAAHPEYAAAGITLGGSKGDKVYGPGGAYWGDAVIAAGEGGKGKSGLSGDTGSAGGGSTLGALGYGFGSSMAPWNTPFTPRDPSQIANDPAFKFQMEQGLKGIQNSAAARGTLLSGGTLKSLDQFGQGLASTYDDKFYGRDLGEYLLNRENFYNNEDRPFSKNLSLAQLGAPR